MAALAPPHEAQEATPQQRPPAVGGGYEYRCPKCNKLLFTGNFTGWVRTICKARECDNKLRRFEEP